MEKQLVEAITNFHDQVMLGVINAVSMGLSVFMVLAVGLIISRLIVIRKRE